MKRLLMFTRMVLNSITNRLGLIPLYLKGAPNPFHNKIGFLSSVVVTPAGDFSSAISSVSKSLRQPAQFVDKEGYDNQIIAAAVHPKFNWKAWIESREKEVNYHVDIVFKLKIMKDSQITHTWIVETYNPYFGCRVGYMQWHSENIVTIYREKHRTYVCSIGLDYEEMYISVADNWVVKDSILYFIDDGDVWVDTNLAAYRHLLPEEVRQYSGITFQKAFSENQVERISLPDLAILPPITRVEAIGLGVLATDELSHPADSDNSLPPVPSNG